MAKTETTVRGYVYTVTSPNGGTVTDAEGKLNKPVDAGDQVTVTAPSDSLTCSDDDAVICKANFKSPLLALRLLGQGANALPAGYTRVDFLESTGAQYIDTGLKIPIDSTVELVAQYTEHHTTHQALYGWRTLNGATALMAWVTDSLNPPHFYAVINASEPSIVLASETLEKFRLKYEWGSVQFNDLVKTIAKPTPVEPTETFGLFGAKRNAAAYCRSKARIWSARIADSAGNKYEFVPVLDPAGEPRMFDLVTREPFRNAGSGQFVAGVGTLAQLSTLLQRLPVTGGTLTLSLPAEANTPEVADMLQACHDTKGWTLTVYEYRPAATATYSLRRVRSVIWCRREQGTNGGFIDETGARWQIDRCAAIFGSHGNDPTAYGYTPFHSVDEAAAHWELTPYVEPSAELETELETEPETELETEPETEPETAP